MAAKDCTADFVIDDEEVPKADFRQGTSGPKPARTPGQQQRRASGPQGGSSAKRPPLSKTPNAETDEALDPHKLTQRQKMIDKGKNTLGYQTYIQKVPKETRTREHPSTPDVHMKASKRRFDGIVKVWRRQLHRYDPSSSKDDQDQDETAAAGAMEHSPPLPARPEGDAMGGGDENAAPCDDDMGSRGSFDGYFAPKNKSQGKRTREPGLQELTTNELPNSNTQPNTNSGWGSENGLPQPKRSATSRSMDASHASMLLASTCSNQAAPGGSLGGIAGLPPSAPTSFAGLGLAARGSSGALAAPAAAADAENAAPPAAQRPRIAAGDNIVAMILGPEAGSCMSWASDT